MADLSSGDQPVDATNGRVKAHQDIVAPPPGVLEDEQTLADREQTLADGDQTGSDSDQTAADSEQAAADSDQEASDRDLVHGGDRAAHDATRDLRDRSNEQRRKAAHSRVETAAARDVAARERDLVATARDRAAQRHDRELAAGDRSWAAREGWIQDAEIPIRAEENRMRAAADRADAAGDRLRAAVDREQAALDREQGARDRVRAQQEQEELRSQLALAETDSLTGTRTRGPGLADLENEIHRARRAKGALTISYIDIVGLKAVNDEHGHTAGDILLQQAVRAIRTKLRPYDLIVRLGGDEFLCVMSGTTIEEAHQRFGAVQAALAADPDRCEIKVGFAALAPEDSGADLLQRADSELPMRRER